MMMLTKFRRLGLVLGATMVVYGSAQASEGSAEDPLIREGRALTEAFFAGEDAMLWDRFSAAMRNALGAREALGMFRQQLEQQLGAEQEVLHEQLGQQDSIGVYQRIGRWDRAPTPIVITWAVGDDGQIEGFHVGPAQGWAPESRGARDAPGDGGFPDAAAVRELLRAFVDEQMVARGVMVALVDAGGTKVFAHGDAGDGAAADPATVFEAASISKGLTGLLLAEMIAAGEVRRDQPIAELLPAEFSVDPRVGAITLEDLATHRSGLPRIGPGPAMLARLQDDQPYAGSTPEELLAGLLALDAAEVEAARGGYGYSNYGTALLGQLLAIAAGETYEALVQQRVCKPLGLAPAVFDPAAAPGRRAVGSNGARVMPAWQVDAYAPAAGWQASLADLVALASALMNNEPEWVPASFQPSAVPGAPGGQMGLGWHLASAGGSPVVWHNGATFGSSSYLAVIPERGLGIAILANAGGGVADTLAAALLPR